MVNNAINCQCIYSCRDKVRNMSLSKRVEEKAIEDTKRVAEEAKSIQDKRDAAQTLQQVGTTTTTGSSTRLSTHIA